MADLSRLGDAFAQVRLIDPAVTEDVLARSAELAWVYRTRETDRVSSHGQHQPEPMSSMTAAACG